VRRGVSESVRTSHARRVRAILGRRSNDTWTVGRHDTHVASGASGGSTTGGVSGHARGHWTNPPRALHRRFWYPFSYTISQMVPLAMTRRSLLAFALLVLAGAVQAQERDLVVTGGWLFAATGDARVRNPGILVRGGKLLRVGGELPVGPTADTVRVAEGETIIPGMFDLHAHYGVDFFGGGRVEETAAYPELFIANGVTSTFPAGEHDPAKMRALRVAIENGERVGPRLLNSGPYFGTARGATFGPDYTPEQIRADVDLWAERGARGFKAKGITAPQLRALIERAHFHGLTVTGHLDSGNRNSVNPRDAILMGIDRIEHFVGGDAFVADQSAYASFATMRFDTPEFRRIAALYKQHRVYYDATRSAYGYYGSREPAVFADFADEKRFLTPYVRSVVAARPPRRVNEQFEKIYWVKQKELKAFYDAGNGDLITLGTDHPLSDGYLTPFGVHRELLALSLAGIPNAAVLRIATINGARAMGLGDRLGTIEPGKWADMVVVRGDPVADVRAVRNPRVVVKAGRVYDPAALMKSAEGKIGPASAADSAAWAPDPPRRRAATQPPSSR
jgi:imidazolonepropionase-like amidohydrolase